MPLTLRPAILPIWPIVLLLAITTLATGHAAFITGQIPDFAKLSAVGLDLLALVLASAVMPRNFTVGFLLSMLSFVISWRVSAIFGAVPAMAAAGVTVVYYILLYFDAMRADWKASHAEGWFGHLQWQMTTLRIYFGFDMVGHLTEKLFAGSHSFHFMATQFDGFGVPDGALFVILSGLCELGIAIGIGTGLLTRLAGFCAALYYMIANQYGGHFENGFTWSNRPDGGWEFPVLMAIFYLSFTLSGAGKFSIDGWLIERGLMPRFLLPLCRSSGA
jgi:putative oxidoreductase